MSLLRGTSGRVRVCCDGRVLTLPARGSRARDVLVALLTAAAGVLLIWQGMTGTLTSGEPPTGSPWWFLVPQAVMLAAMLGKRRAPLLALTVGVLAFGLDLAWGGSLGVLIALWDLIFTAVLLGSEGFATWLRRGTLALTTLVAAVVLVASGDIRQVVTSVLVVGGAIYTPVWWGTDVRREATLAALQAEHARLERDHVLREERTRMARDLHDAIAGDLSAIALQAEAGVTGPADRPDDAERLRSSMQAVRASSVHALREMTSMIDLLRRGAPPDERTSPARLAELPGLVDRARSGGLAVTLHLPDSLPPLPVAVEHAAFRIVQESLTNAGRHGRGGRAEVRLEAATDGLDISVVNELPEAQEGAGRTAAPGASAGTGVGLAAMRERAEALRGWLEAGWVDQSRARWRVRAHLPGAS